MLNDANTMPGRLDWGAWPPGAASSGPVGVGPAPVGSDGRAGEDEGPALSSPHATQKTRRLASTARRLALRLGKVGEQDIRGASPLVRSRDPDCAHESAPRSDDGARTAARRPDGRVATVVETSRKRRSRIWMIVSGTVRAAIGHGCDEWTPWWRHLMIRARGVNICRARTRVNPQVWPSRQTGSCRLAHPLSGEPGHTPGGVLGLACASLR